MSRMRIVPVLLLGILLFAGCAGPGTEIAVEPALTVPESGETDSLEVVDGALFGALAGLLPSREEWPPREAVYPAGGDIRIITRSVPLSSLAYLPRLRSRIERGLEKAGYTDFRIEGYPTPSGETWEIEVLLEESLRYRVYLPAELAGRVAVIIDDCGNSLRNRQLLLQLDLPITLAVLPRLAYTSACERLAADNGFQVILHCPMEGLNPDLDPGPGVLIRAQEPGELTRRFEENIRGLPSAVGVNNHMGSAFTTDSTAMALLMEELSQRNLFFVDSLTVPGTVTGSVAAAAGVEYVSRDVFLDHENSEEFILGQLAILKRKALRQGSAIAIGHDRALTLEILARELPALAGDNLRVVPVSDLLEN